jgi:hypothetical protein
VHAETFLAEDGGRTDTGQNTQAHRRAASRARS